MGLSQFTGDYKKLPKNVYEVIKYSIIFPQKNTPSVYVGMLEKNFCKKYQTNSGIVVDNDGWHVCIERYYKDLMNALDELDILWRNIIKLGDIIPAENN